jgi:hypothetical protein
MIRIALKMGFRGFRTHGFCNMQQYEDLSLLVYEQCRLIICYRCFGVAYCFNLKGNPCHIPQDFDLYQQCHQSHVTLKEALPRSYELDLMSLGYCASCLASSVTGKLHSLIFVKWPIFIVWVDFGSTQRPCRLRQHFTKT